MTKGGLFGLFTIIITSILYYYSEFPLPPLFVSSTIIVCICVFVVGRYGLFSPAALITALVAYPALVPFFAGVLGVHPTLRAIPFQSQEVIVKSVYLSMVALLVFVATLRSRLDISLQDETRASWIKTPPVFATWPAVISISTITLVMAYLTAPGPTILTVSYETVIDNYYGWATFAGSMYTGAWIMLYLCVRDEETSSWFYRVFVLVTIISIIWLVLHARRNESMGLLTLLIITYLNKRTDFQQLLKSTRGKLVSSCFIAISGLMFVVEELRSAKPVDGMFTAESNYGTYLSPPGGAHNIYSTWQVSVATFDASSLLYGHTFVYLPIQTIPTPIWRLTGLERPAFFHETISSVYPNYPGGMYILSPYYVNFDIFGVIFCGALLGILISFATRTVLLSDDTTVMTGLGCSIVVGAYRAIWYNQLAWVNTMQAFLVALVIYFAITNVCIIYSSSKHLSK